MQRIKNYIPVMVCIIMTIMFCNINSKAAGSLDGQVIDGSLLTSDIYAEDIKPLLPEVYSDDEIVPYGNYLSNGVTSIKDQGGGTVYISGETYCYKMCDTIKVNLYLEQLSNGSWHTVQTQPHTAYNTYAASNGVYFAVAKGYYYRVRGYHSAKKGSTLETTDTCTNGIYIN